MKIRSCWLLALALGAVPLHADETAAPRLDLGGPAATAATAVAAQDLGEPGPVPDHRSPECPGCPERHPTRAIVEAIGINVGLNWFNRLTHAEPDQFYTDPKSWWENLKHGFVFDDNNFSTNQFAHPYHGGLYFNAARSNGLGYWASAPVAAMGSFTWECCGETHEPSFNDFISTTMGGIAVGEVLHRLGNLVRDNRKTGKGRFFREAAGFIINPITEANRLTNGDAWEVRENPGDARPDYLGAALDFGNIWRGEGGTLDETSSAGYAELEMVYGDPFRTRSKKPFDHFTMSARIGGGKSISQFNLSGRLFGGHEGSTRAPSVFQVSQGFTYITNPAYELGGQHVDAGMGFYREVSSTMNFIASGTASFIPLGSITAEHVDVNERTYDMGIGGGLGGRAGLWRKGFPVLQVAYSLFYIHTVNGSSGEHIAQYINGRVGWPLFGRFGIGAAGALYLRNSYYEDFDDTFHKHPEVRAFLSWRFE
jgi:hypothetical protein